MPVPAWISGAFLHNMLNKLGTIGLALAEASQQKSDGGQIGTVAGEDLEVRRQPLPAGKPTRSSANFDH